MAERAAPRPVVIDQMWRGANSQAPWDQVEGQVNDALNVRLDVVKGAIKRNPTELVADLVLSDIENKDGDVIFTGASETFDIDADIHWTSIRDIIIAIGRLGDTDQTPFISAWDTDGTPVTIVDYQGLGVTDPGDTPDFSYFPDNNMFIKLRSAVGVDTILVVNRQKGSLATDNMVIKAWSFRQSYNYIVHGSENPDGGDGDEIIPYTNTLADPTGDGFGQEPTPEFADKFENLQSAINYFQRSHSAALVDGQVIRTLFDWELDPAGYYVYYSGTPYPKRGVLTNAGEDPASVIVNAADELFPRHRGEWYRIPQGRGASGGGNDPGDKGQADARLDSDLWPQRLLYNEDNNRIYWTRGPWKQRLSGNTASNPKPEQIRVTDARFFQNRLVLSQDTGIIGSRANDYFNHFVDNVLANSDDDRFRNNIFFANIGNAERLAECGQRLMILAEAGQIEFGSGAEALTNVNGQTRVISRFKSRNIRPGEGPGTCTIIDENRNVLQFSFISAELGVAYTGHLNIHDKDRWFTYSPKAVLQISNLTFVTTVNGDTFMHSMFHLEGNEVQSAWARVRTTGTIRHVDEWQQYQRWIIVDDIGWTMVKYIHDYVAPPADLEYWPGIDRLERVQGVYDPDANETTFTHTGRSGDLDDTRIVLASDDNQHKALIPARIESNGDVVVTGNYGNDTSGEGKDPYIGFLVKSKLILGKLYAGISANIMTLTQLFVFHIDSTDYVVKLEKPDGTTASFPWQSDVVGVSILDQPRQVTGASQHLAFGDARYNEIQFIHESTGIVTWAGVQYWLDMQGVSI